MRTASMVYDAVAREFDECNPCNKLVLQEVFAAARQFGPSRFSALDVGCGTGTHSIPLAQAMPNCQLVGIDASHEMAEIAREKFPLSKWLHGDFFSTDLPARAFDLVLSINSIHLMNWRQFILRCNRIVSRNGKVLVITGDRQDYSNIYYDNLPLLREKDLLHYPRSRQMREQFEAIGFKTNCKKLDCTRAICSAQEMESVLAKARLRAESLFHLVDEQTLAACVHTLAESLKREVAQNGAAIERETLYAIEAKRVY